MAGRIGNKGYSYFSESAYKNLQEAVKLMGQYLDEQKKSYATDKEKEEQMKRLTRYEQELKDLGVQRNEISEQHLQNRKDELKYEAEIFKTQQKQIREKKAQQKRDERAREFEKAFQLETSGRTDEEIRQQRILDQIKEDGLKRVQDLRLNEEKRKKIQEETTQEYNRQLKTFQQLNEANKEAERKAEAKKNARKDFLENGIGALFGTNSQAIQDVKDGTYWWKLGTKVFKTAVETFKNAVDKSITANYNSTEDTLNRITASNRISWSGGKFNLSQFGFASSKDYYGFKEINNAINDQLSAEGLYNNISNVDVMKAVAKLTSQEGLNLEQAIAKGYQDTVIKYIVPYLDTTSEAFNNVEYLMPRNFKKYSFYSHKC